MAWSEAENKKAGWLQKKLRLRVEDALKLADLAAELGASQSDVVALLVRQATRGRGKAIHHIDGNPLNNTPSNLRMVNAR